MSDDDPAPTEPRPRVVRVLPDVPAIDKTFDYLVPDALGDQVRVGTVVRVELHGRRVGGWVVADDVEPPPGVALLPARQGHRLGPAARADRPGRLGGVALVRAGRHVPGHGVGRSRRARAAPPVARRHRPATVAAPVGAEHDALIRRRASPARRSRAAPAAGRRPLPGGAGRGRGWATRWSWRRRSAGARHLGSAPAPGRRRRRHPAQGLGRGPGRLGVRRRRGRGVGAGARPRRGRGARRARRGVPGGGLADLARPRRRHRAGPAGRGAVRAGVARRPASRRCSGRGDDGLLVPVARRSSGRAGRSSTSSTAAARSPGAAGLYSERFVKAHARGARHRWCACSTARAGPACWRAPAAARRPAASTARRRWPRPTTARWSCRSCGTERPVVCQACGATDAEEPAGRRHPGPRGARGAGPRAGRRGHRRHRRRRAARRRASTSAPRRCCTRSRSAALVAFLDFDQELLAPALPRRRAGDGAAGPGAPGCVGGGRRDGGRVLVQTRLPQHEVLQAALLAEPGRAADAEWERRRFLRFPPVTAMAAVGSVRRARPSSRRSGTPPASRSSAPATASWLVRAARPPDPLRRPRRRHPPARPPAPRGRPPPHLTAPTPTRRVLTRQRLRCTGGSAVA